MHEPNLKAAPVKKPRAKYLEHSTTDKLVKFVKANPDEELTFRDMQAKFSCSIAALSRAVCMLREEGIIEDKPRVIRLAKQFR